MFIFDIDSLGPNLPPDIAELLQHLREIDERILEESELEATRGERDVIYRRLEAFRESRAPIRRVPREVLQMIFEKCTEEQRYRNSSLMQVCKLWYDILMHTSRLWNNIVLIPTILEDLPDLWLYSITCLTCSGTLPLDIHIDASHFEPRQSAHKVLMSHWNRHASNYTLVGGDRLDFNDVENRQNTVYECALLMMIAVLRGKEDIFISRWRTFCLKTSSIFGRTTLSRLWDSIDGATDNLARLEFLGSHCKPRKLRSTGFPTLKSLTAFATSMEMAIDRTYHLPFANLEQLVLLNPYSSTRFLAFASSKLRSLIALQLNMPSFDLPELSASNWDIHLPALKALVLSGDGHGSVLLRLNAPHLTHLSVQNAWKAQFTSSPVLHNITDLLLGYLCNLERSPELRSMISSSSSLKRVHFRNLYDPLVAKMVQEVRYMGKTAVDWVGGSPDWPYEIPQNWYEIPRNW